MGMTLLRKASTQTFNNFIDVTKDLERLRSLVEPIPAEASRMLGRGSSNGSPQVKRMPVYAKPVFVSTMSTVLDLYTLSQVGVVVLHYFFIRQCLVMRSFVCRIDGSPPLESSLHLQERK